MASVGSYCKQENLIDIKLIEAQKQEIFSEIITIGAGLEASFRRLGYGYDTLSTGIKARVNSLKSALKLELQKGIEDSTQGIRQERWPRNYPYTTLKGLIEFVSL